VRVGLVIGQLSAGGAEGQLWLLCKGLDHAVARPIVYCLSDRTEPYGSLVEAAGVPLRIITGGQLTRLRKLRQWLHSDRLDVVHAWLFIANAYAWLANCGAGRPLVTSARNCKRQGRALDWLNRRALAASDAIVANSSQVAQYIQGEYGAPQPRIRVISNGIDTERFHPRDVGDGEVAGPIVAVGRLVEQKNHALFLRAAADLARLVPKAQFVIAGDGPLRGALEAQARQLGIADRVQFTGERRDIETLLRAGSILWQTTIANKLFDYMASGLPVIATDVGGTRELVRSGVDGFVVSEDDAAAFVRHSQELLQPGTRLQFAAAARARAEEFSVARMVKALSELYEDVLGRSR
jgi:glycosyltransferase involved in cell wall biosynthesis